MRTRLSPVLVIAAAVSIDGAHAADATPPPAPPPVGRVRLSLRGGFVPGSPTFTDTRTFTEFAEQGRLESRYTQDPGPGFEAGVAFRITRRLAVSTALSFARRKEVGAYAAVLPHPLYFAAARRVEGDFGGRHERETAFHLDVAGLGGSGRLQWTVFAGPSAMGVKADLLRAVEYTHVYPYDAVTVTGTAFASSSGHAFGFNAGASLDWQLARHVAIGTQVRFARAKVRLEPTSDDRVDVDAGGVHLAGGLRLDF